jgi:hypothetical protein
MGPGLYRPHSAPYSKETKSLLSVRCNEVMEETMTIEDLEKRVKMLEDKDEIKELHREYLFFISNLEIEKALDCFTRDIEVEVANYGICRGKDEVARFFREVIYQNVLQSRDGHFTGQPVITVSEEKASGHWMFYRFVQDPSRRWIQGRYDCEYVKENGKWKFSVLKMRRPWPEFLADIPEDQDRTETNEEHR